MSNDLDARDGICLVEDDEILQSSLKQRFELEGLPCAVYSTLKEAIDVLHRNRFDILLCDVRLPDGDCADAFRFLLEEGVLLPPVLFMTGYPSVEQAVDLLRHGAGDYIVKPFEVTELLGKIETLAPKLFRDSEDEAPFELGVSVAARGLTRVLDRLAERSVSVLISGESGVGKEYAARYLHQRRFPEPGHPFRAINCAALPETLLEAELFGHEKGAFTGADRARPGLIELASGGTLFLDEVGEMPAAMQAKLLRVLQERTLTHLGGKAEIPVEVELVSATNRDLRAMVEAGQFREDLYYRLHVVHVEIPPLRERPEDILWFARQLIAREARLHPPRRRLSPAAESWLTSQPWPGNARELMHVLERSLIFSECPVLTPADFQDVDMSRPSSGEPKAGLRDCLKESERWYIEQALEQHGWRMGETAEALKISRKNLWERMNRLGIERRSGSRESV